MQISTNTTTCRALMETFSAEEFHAGRITSLHKQFIHDINGHSGEIANTYYVQDRFKTAISQINVVMDTMVGEIVESDLPNVTIEVDELEAPRSTWGSKHIDFNSDKSRARWSKKELKYLRKTIKHYLKENRERYRNKLMSVCLKHIYNDPAATPIFHRLHILNTAKLRNGWNALKCQYSDVE